MFPSKPTVMSSGPLAFDTGNIPVTAPEVAILTMRSPRASVSHSPPGPLVKPSCSPRGISPARKIVHAPAVVRRPTAEARNSVTQSAPSGPVTIRRGSLPGGSGTRKKLSWPARVTRPTKPVSRSVNHIAPSGPRVIESGRPGTGKTPSSLPFLEIRATNLPTWSDVIHTSRPGPLARSRTAFARQAFDAAELQLRGGCGGRSGHEGREQDDE